MRITVAAAVGFVVPIVGAAVLATDLALLGWVKLAGIGTRARRPHGDVGLRDRTHHEEAPRGHVVRPRVPARDTLHRDHRRLARDGRFERAQSLTTPLVLSVSLATLIARRDLRQLSRLPTRRRSRLLRVEPPNLDQIRKALRGRSRPVTVRWVVFGTFVTTGIMTTSVAVSVYVGHRAGVDFAAVDRAADGALSALLLLGAAVLGAFPISGFLLARASNAEGVLEPALGAACAIAGIVVLLGLAAPVAVVFALAFAPVAFALACVGAWVGATR